MREGALRLLDDHFEISGALRYSDSFGALGWDSVTVFEALLVLEEYSGIDADFEKMDQLMTIGDLIAVFETSGGDGRPPGSMIR